MMDVLTFIGGVVVGLCFVTGAATIVDAILRGTKK